MYYTPEDIELHENCRPQAGITSEMLLQIKKKMPEALQGRKLKAGKKYSDLKIEAGGTKYHVPFYYIGDTEIPKIAILRVRRIE